jgi:hypothetical protein
MCAYSSTLEVDFFSNPLPNSWSSVFNVFVINKKCQTDLANCWRCFYYDRSFCSQNNPQFKLSNNIDMHHASDADQKNICVWGAQPPQPHNPCILILFLFPVYHWELTRVRVASALSWRDCSTVRRLPLFAAWHDPHSSAPEPDASKPLPPSLRSALMSALPSFPVRGGAALQRAAIALGGDLRPRSCAATGSRCFFVAATPCRQISSGRWRAGSPLTRSSQMSA